MHEEKDFLSGWLRKDVRERDAEMKSLNERAKQEESKSWKREVEREEEMVEMKRGCWDRCPVILSRTSVPWLGGRMMEVP